MNNHRKGKDKLDEARRTDRTSTPHAGQDRQDVYAPRRSGQTGRLRPTPVRTDRTSTPHAGQDRQDVYAPFSQETGRLRLHASQDVYAPHWLGQTERLRPRRSGQTGRLCPLQSGDRTSTSPRQSGRLRPPLVRSDRTSTPPPVRTDRTSMPPSVRRTDVYVSMLVRTARTSMPPTGQVRQVAFLWRYAPRRSGQTVILCLDS